MKELMILLAKEMPVEILIEKLKEAIHDFENGGGDDAKRQLAFYCYMVSMRFMTEKQDTADTIQEFKSSEQLLAAFRQKS